MNIPSNITTLIAGIAITLVSLWVGQNHGLLPIAASADANDVDDLFNLMMTIATGLFFLIEGVLVICLIRFRRKEGDMTDGPSIEGNVPLEIVWTAIPTVIVFILAIYSFEIYNNMGGLDPMVSGGSSMAMHQHHHHGSQNLENMVAMGEADDSQMALGIGKSPGASDEPPIQVNVNGLQYAWIFTYPETGIVSGDLHIPKDRRVLLNMQAADVIHAFWLPEFRIKQDVMPGQESQLSFVANREGTYPVICAELCGAYHGGMKTTMTVDSPEAYDQWVQDHTIAMTDSESVAVNPSELSDADYLQAYAKDMGIIENTLKQIPHRPLSTLPVVQP
ncbi:cytochrome C oxidase subunit II transmembrane region [[Leptolyngbya] sp. PCC 7376]|uniref:cytochrome c oxidase subunit II n=1 Tax=[Leptolyngbya] sp. PCC 7376 TaxID=111781 RepID=UPI00029F0089|nr:cytochrome c oxidase subunit II [[Leptolyngbya] sp. PCC 7376]AFY38146.1 cytochrome C oxidase subunit II transmembrane region [[Leptolyngbya] sp. PCC 7376]